MHVASHKRLAEHFGKIESLCDEGWRICRQSPEAAEQWAGQHSVVWPTVENPLPRVLTRAIRYIQLHGLSEALGGYLSGWTNDVCNLIDSRPIEHTKLSDTLYQIWEYAHGHREELEAKAVGDSQEALQVEPQCNGQGTGNDASALWNQLKIYNDGKKPYIEWQRKQYHGLPTGTCEAFQKMYDAKGEAVGIGSGEPLRKPSEWYDNLPEPLQNIVAKGNGKSGYRLTIFSPPTSA
jgi:hypothetical protein